MHAMNYFQSWKENGTPNSNGSIRISYGCAVSAWDFGSKSWAPCGNELPLDENGVLSGIFKMSDPAYYGNSAIYVFDSGNELIRMFLAPRWDEERWEAVLARAGESADELGGLRRFKKIPCAGEEGIADITGEDGLVMAINDSGKEGKIKWAKYKTAATVHTPLPDKCIAVFIGDRDENGAISHFNLG